MQYLCGPAGNMPAQMEEAAVNAIATAGNMSQEEAQAMVTEWKVSSRSLSLASTAAWGSSDRRLFGLRRLSAGTTWRCGDQSLN